MAHYLRVAARNKGWEMEVVRNIPPYLLRFSKESMIFYSSKFLNIDVNHQPSKLSDNKWLTQTVLQREGVRILEISVLNPCNDETIKTQYDIHSKHGALPVILKPINSYNSRGLYMCSSLEEVLEKKDKMENELYCISTFYPHFLEIRFIIFGGKVQLLYPKYENPFQSEFKRNPHIKLSQIRKMKKEALRSADALGFDFVAVDFLVSKDDFILLEVNLNPNPLDYTDEKPKQFNKVVRYCEKMFEYKETLLKLEKK